jgi:transposase-like protein
VASQHQSPDLESRHAIDGLLKTVLETALNEEITEHLGYQKHDPPETGTGNIRNGTRAPRRC